MGATEPPPTARILLSPPDVGAEERELLLDALESNWVAPLGPHVDTFEAEVAALVGARHAVALSSGTAALHLALLAAGVGPDDEVVVPTLTFAATANAVCYVDARPVFVDSEQATWNLDPPLLAEELDACAARGRLPAAVVTVDLYGQCADHDAILEVCGRHEVPVIEDAAEALGATYRGRAAGTFGLAGVYSFNGNKIITTSGGGMLVTHDAEVADQVRHLANQAREPAPHYEHATVGFNYRMSNLLAAVGRGQLRSLDEKVARRRAINARYRATLGDLPGVAFMPFSPAGEPNAWLTCLTIDPELFGADREEVRLRLDAEGIEARPVWKPMHLQPAFSGFRARGGAVAERLFAHGLCLPSGSSLTDADQDRVIAAVRAVHRAADRTSRPV